MKKVKRLFVNRLLEISLLLIFIGLIIMAAGSKNPENRFDYIHITLSPVIILAGYILVIVAIMKKKTN